MAISPTVFNCEVPALNQTRFTQPLPKRRHTIVVRLCRAGTEKTDHGHSRLLRARRERPCGCCAGKRDKQFSPLDVGCHVTLPWGHIHVMAEDVIMALFR